MPTLGLFAVPLHAVLSVTDAKVLCRYAKGEQVFLCYGKYTNLELLGKFIHPQYMDYCTTCIACNSSWYVHQQQ